MSSTPVFGKVLNKAGICWTLGPIQTILTMPLTGDSVASLMSKSATLPVMSQLQVCRQNLLMAAKSTPPREVNETNFIILAKLVLGNRYPGDNVGYTGITFFGDIMSCVIKEMFAFYSTSEAANIFFLKKDSVNITQIMIENKGKFKGTPNLAVFCLDFGSKEKKQLVPVKPTVLIHLNNEAYVLLAAFFHHGEDFKAKPEFPTHITCLLRVNNAAFENGKSDSGKNYAMLGNARDVKMYTNQEIDGGKYSKEDNNSGYVRSIGTAFIYFRVAQLKNVL